MMGSDATLEGPPQFRDLAPQPAPRQFRQALGIVFAPHEGLQHLPPRYSQHVGGDARQLDVGVLEHLVDTVYAPRLLTTQLRPLPRQIAQLTLLPRRNEAA